MRKLTLTKSERDAMDWIGYRYPHGYDFYKLLMDADWHPKTTEVINDVTYTDGPEWDSEGEITFHINDELFFRIQQLLSECDYDCIVDSFAEKLMNLLLS